MLIAYRDLYPGAIGHKSDLDRMVFLQRIDTFEVAATSSGKDLQSTISYESASVPSAEGGVVNMLTGGYAALNNVRAESGDGLLYHIAHEDIRPLWVVEQHKSLGTPDQTSAGVLFTSKVREEQQKISGQKHLKFFAGTDFLLVIITNKPLAKMISGISML